MSRYMSRSLTRSGGENVPAFLAHSQPTILCMWQEAHVLKSWITSQSCIAAFIYQKLEHCRFVGQISMLCIQIWGNLRVLVKSKSAGFHLDNVPNWDSRFQALKWHHWGSHSLWLNYQFLMESCKTFTHILRGSSTGTVAMIGSLSGIMSQWSNRGHVQRTAQVTL